MRAIGVCQAVEVAAAGEAAMSIIRAASRAWCSDQLYDKSYLDGGMDGEGR